jgi:3-phenylpropionate/cinnamic acid dioxygenase small subunit
MDPLEELKHRFAIEKVMQRYARGVDRLQWDDVRACFHKDAPDEHGDVVGTFEDMITYTIKRHTRIPFSQHFLGNCLIEFTNEGVAVVETYFVAWQMMTGDETSGDTDLDIFGRYLDRFERRGEEWRIAHRKVIFDSMRARTSQEVPIKPNWIRGQRDTSDPIYEFRYQAGLANQHSQDF